MKNSFAIFLAVLSIVSVFSSCSNDDESANSPYAYIKSFGVDDIKSKYPAFNAEGKDTTVTKTISMKGYPFTINQATGEIYNADSLPYATNLTKIVMNMSVEGVARMYDDALGTYEYFKATDSIDFTSPRKFQITSLDGNYSKYYTVSINAHKVEPELMVWNNVERLAGVTALKAIEFNGGMHLFGTTEGKLIVAVAPVTGDVAWEKYDVTGLPLTANFSAIAEFGGELYAVADGNLYKSSDAMTWSVAASGSDLIAVVGASDSRMWLAGSDALYTTADGVALEPAGTLPEHFPLYGISTASYPLSHNKDIVRYMLVGYDTPAMDGKPYVWSKLSTENGWAKYDNVENPYPCPALKGLAVMRYGGFLYAIGGSGKVSGADVEAFSSFYISKDNGIVWKAYEGFYQLLPESLKGYDGKFAAAVDSRNFMWIVTSGEKAVALKGIINRLGFNK
ncbi:MAG: hypothetical protein IJY44_01965 [Bacteroidaceae bacterium]|nr:hypothetical protein [Bacteroidaceae bacterium]